MKRLFTVITAISLCISASAQGGGEEKGTNEFSINVGYNFGLEKNSFGLVTLQPEYGHHFTDNFYLGIGTGLVADDGFDMYSIPLFLRAEVDFNAGKITPYISLQGGYDFNVSDGDSWARINPSVGVKVPLSNTVGLNIGFGYTRIIVSGGGSNLLGFNAGINFNSQGKGFKNFLKKLDYSVELETYTSVSSKYMESSNIEDKETFSGIFGLNLSALGEMPVDNLYAGLSLGIGRYTDKWQSGSYTDKTSEIYLNVMARVKYKVKQLTFAGKFYPFAQADIGLSGFEPTFAFNPAVGLSMMTGKKESIDLTLGYASIGMDDASKGSLRIALGYTF